LDTMRDPATGTPLACDAISTAGWGNDDYVRLQEALFRLAQQVHADGSTQEVVPRNAWSNVAAAVSQTKALAPVVLVSRHILFCGIEKHRQALHNAASGASASASATTPSPEAVFSAPSPAPSGDPADFGDTTGHSAGSLHHSSSAPIPAAARAGTGTPTMGDHLGESPSAPGQLPSSFGTVAPPWGPCPPGDSFLPATPFHPHVGSFSGSMEPSSLPNMDSATHFLDRSFRCPREPRITVWDPNNGRTVSGNAAPCRKNLDQWLQQHPGWVVKGEDQLSSSRRARRTPPAPVPARSPALNPHGSAVAGSAPATSLASSAGAQQSVFEPERSRDGPLLSAALGLLAIGQVDESPRRRQSSAMTSSVSSGSSHDQDNGTNEEEDDDVDMNVVAMEM
jgi:hypothetical protein